MTEACFDDWRELQAQVAAGPHWLRSTASGGGICTGRIVKIIIYEGQRQVIFILDPDSVRERSPSRPEWTTPRGFTALTAHLRPADMALQPIDGGVSYDARYSRTVLVRHGTKEDENPFL